MRILVHENIYNFCTAPASTYTQIINFAENLPNLSQHFQKKLISEISLFIFKMNNSFASLYPVQNSRARWHGKTDLALPVEVAVDPGRREELPAVRDVRRGPVGPGRVED